MKLFTADQIRNADEYTIANEPVSSLALMERASKAFVKQFEKDFPEKKIHKLIVCGTGNNGGDGLAIARILLDKLHTVKVFIIPSEKQSADFKKNLTRLQKKHKRAIQYWNDVSALDELPVNAIVIDGIFGTGLNKPVAKDSIYYNVISKLNSFKFQQVISVDIPSGLFADKSTAGIVLRSDKTYTFQFPKLSFLLPESEKYVNEFTILNIGLHKDYIDKEKTPFNFLIKEDLLKIMQPRKTFSHKGTYGHAGIIAGSYGKMGAAVLCSKACLRSGAGLVTAHIPSSGYTIFQTTFPEAMCSTDKNTHHITEMPSWKNYNAIGIGPGIGTDSSTVSALENFIKAHSTPLVVDADALNIISQNKNLLEFIPANSIFTPHPKEFERLAGKWKNDFERLEIQRKFSKKNKVIVVLKGANTSITDIDGNVYFNSTGNAGMATAGSGDVLTGIITGLLAQQYSPVNSALFAVFLHGLAGDLALQQQSMESLIASDIIENLGNAFKELEISGVE
jgi:NAD(P)H-hydrate epimerase